MTGRIMHTNKQTEKTVRVSDREIEKDGESDEEVGGRVFPHGPQPSPWGQPMGKNTSKLPPFPFFWEGLQSLNSHWTSVSIHICPVTEWAPCFFGLFVCICFSCQFI